MSTLRRLYAHDSTRAYLLILALFAACAIAEQICRLMGVGLMDGVVP
jgi:hypothetical protein